MAKKPTATKLAAKKPAAGKKVVIPKSPPALVARMQAVAARHTALRAGSMFGCAALFSGKRAVIAVFGDELCLTLPQPTIDRLITSKGFRPFQPLDSRPPMRGWVLVAGARIDELAKPGSLLEDAIAYADSKNDT